MKFEREDLVESGELLWRPKEVKLDMYANDKLNRIYMGTDNNLIIKDFKSGMSQMNHINHE